MSWDAVGKLAEAAAQLYSHLLRLCAVPCPAASPVVNPHKRKPVLTADVDSSQ